eukprot:Pgem_evm1s6687
MLQTISAWTWTSIVGDSERLTEQEQVQQEQEQQEQQQKLSYAKVTADGAKPINAKQFAIQQQKAKAAENDWVVVDENISEETLIQQNKKSEENVTKSEKLEGMEDELAKVSSKLVGEDWILY